MLTRCGFLFTLAAVGASGCYESDDDDTNSDFEVNCLDVQCPWQVEAGHPHFAQTWHDGDVGVDLSAPGKNELEMKVVLIATNSRQLEIDAAVFRDSGAAFRVDFDWYTAGSGTGPTFWDRSPYHLGTSSVPSESTGAYVLHRHVLVPSETSAFVIHLVKEGEGRVFVDELTVGHLDYVRTR